MPEPHRPDSPAARPPFHGSFHPWRLLGLALLAFAAGAALALAFLPEWRAEPLRSPGEYARAFRERATQAGWWLAPGEPRVRLATWRWHHTLLHDLLGDGGSRWLDASGTALAVEVFHPVSRPGEPRQHLFLELTPAGRPWGLSLWPRRTLDFYDFKDPEEAVPWTRELGRLLLGPGERLAPADTLAANQLLWSLSPVEGSSKVTAGPGPRRLLGMTAGVATVFEVPEAPGLGTSRLVEHQTRVMNLMWTPVLVLVGSAALFFGLLARGQLGMLNGALLAAAALALSDLAPSWYYGSWAWSLGAGLGRIALVFFLWSAAESLLRSHRPGFTTSLDNLRRGRLGPRGGRALLAGFAYGALLAGLHLGATALAVPLPGLSPLGPSLSLPFGHLARSPLSDGLYLAGVVALAAAAASRLLPDRWTPWGAAVLAGVFHPAPLLTPLPASLAVQMAFAGLLAVVLRRHGLTALLTAAGVSFLLPAALFALLHAAFFPATAAGLAVAAVAVPLLGALGLRQPAEVEAGAPQPRFVRRLEEARRVRYETDLLVRMQSGMLPRQLPQVPGYEIAARAELATGIGGNLYTVMRDEEGSLWIASGDVDGEGYACSIAQAMIKAALRSLIAPGLRPSQVLRRTAEVLRNVDPQRNRAALALLRLDPATGEGWLANAGHPSPLLFAGDQADEILPAGPLLGNPANPVDSAGPSYDDLAVRLPAGGVLVLTSETLFDEPDRYGVPFGSANLRQVLREAAARPAEEIVEALLRAWRRHLGGEAPADDTTVVVLKRSYGGPA